MRYKPEEDEFDGRLSNFTDTIEMYTLEGERFGYTKLRNGKDQSHLRGEAAHHISCIFISYQIIESCSTGPNDYCSVIIYKRIRICGGRITDRSFKIRQKNRYGRPPFIRKRSIRVKRFLDRVYGHRRILIPNRREPRRLKKPCPGDPIPNPEIAPQTYSKVKGARFGADARKQWNHDKTKLINKAHYGVDLKNSFGDPMYSMFDGTIIDTGVDPNGWGSWIMVKSNIDNQDVIILYAHLDKYNKKSGVIKVGQKLGIAGDSGNLKNAIKKGRAIQHIHIEARIGSTWSKATKTDPEKYIATKFGDDGKVTQKSKC